MRKSEDLCICIDPFNYLIAINKSRKILLSLKMWLKILKSNLWLRLSLSGYATRNTLGWYSFQKVLSTSWFPWAVNVSSPLTLYNIQYTLFLQSSILTTKAKHYVNLFRILPQKTFIQCNFKYALVLLHNQ